MGWIERAVGPLLGAFVLGVAAFGCGGDSRTVTADAVPTDGLIGWYDATRGVEADGRDRVVRWRDRSGAGRHLEAPDREARPEWLRSTVREPPGISFDGLDDVLRVRGGERRAETLHVALVVTPRDNAGKFDGIVSAGAPGREDADSGMRIDLGGREWGNCESAYPEGLEAFNTLNVERAGLENGCGRDLNDDVRPFGIPSVVLVEAGNPEASARVAEMDRRSQPVEVPGQPMRLDHLRLGARYDDGGYRGFFRGAITELLVYERPLSADGREVLEAYLREKYGLR